MVEIREGRLRLLRLNLAFLILVLFVDALVFDVGVVHGGDGVAVQGHHHLLAKTDVNQSC